MDSDYLQRQRFQLQKRFRRLNSCSYLLFQSGLAQFWKYLADQPLFAGVIAKLDAEAPPFADELKGATERSELYAQGSETENVQYSFRIVQHCAAQPLGMAGHGPHIKIARRLTDSTQLSDITDAFRQTYLEPLYEFLDESLDQHAAVLTLLLKYKRKVEWFDREAVASLAASGERALAEHLYGYLFDQGLDFSVEPQSVSGEADLVSPNLVLDAKVFDGDRRNARYLISGVNQVHTYARDYNQAAAYLVIYLACPADVHFSFARPDAKVPFVVLGGKTIYFLTIDLYAHVTTASHRGVMKACTIDADLLVKEIGESLPGAGQDQTK